MDTRQVIARFEAERQAVAMMDHPNIAKLLDAGTTDSGRPYFVMELVKGVPITKYCDEKHLPIRDRLQLFIQVCQAVQHAHQKASSTAILSQAESNSSFACPELVSALRRCAPMNSQGEIPEPSAVFRPAALNTRAVYPRRVQ
jgi:serine/threonine protein kinase